MNNNQSTSRRQWLSRTVRWGLLAVMAAVSAHLLGRRQSGQETPCVDPRAKLGCGNCNRLGGCGLPRALSFKKVTRQYDEKTKS